MGILSYRISACRSQDGLIPSMSWDTRLADQSPQKIPGHEGTPYSHVQSKAASSSVYRRNT